MKPFIYIIVAAILLTMPNAAQDSQASALSGAFDIVLAEDWEIVQQDGVGVRLKSDSASIRIRVYSPGFMRRLDIDGGIQGLLEFLVTDTFETRGFNAEDIEHLSFGENEGIGYVYDELSEGRSYQRQFLAFEATNEFIVLSYLTPLTGEELSSKDIELVKVALSTVTIRDTYEFYDRSIFEVPEGWQLTDDDNYGIAMANLSNGEIAVYSHLWPRYAAMAGFENPRDFLAFIFSAQFGQYGRYDRSLAEDITVAGFDGIFYAFNVQTVNEHDLYPRGVIIFATSTNNNYVSAAVFSASLDTDIEPAYDIMDTFRPGNRTLCPLFADPGDRIRSEPSAGSELVRETDDETLIALSSVTGADGYKWFDVGEGFIRSDVIFYENNTCIGLPSN